MDLRQSLKNKCLENNIFAMILPYAPILALAYPISGLIYYFFDHASAFFLFILAVLFFAYIIGLILCYADEKDMFIGIALIIRALYYLILLPHGYDGTLSYLVYLVVYGGLGGYTLYKCFGVPGKNSYGENVYRGPVSYEEVPVQPVSMNCCPQCGTPREEGFFCPGCGFDYRTVESAGQTRPVGGGNTTTTRTTPTTPYSGPVGRIALLGSNVLTLVFACLITAGILLGYASGFSLLGFVFSIPSLLICIALWLIYVGSSKGTLTTTGFSMINGVLTFEMIGSTLIFVFMGLLGVFVMVVGGGDGDAMKIAITIIVLAIVLAYPVVYYYSQLKKTTKAARSLAKGQNVPFNASMYVIVILCINAFGQVFSALKTLFSGSISNFAVDYILDYCSESLNMAGLGDLTPYLYDIANKLFRHSALESVASIVSAATVIVAIIILVQIRKDRNNTAY